MADPQAQLQALSEEYSKLQSEFQTVVQARQKLETQLQENLSVQEEFEALEEGETIYKMVGTALVEQDKAEAESTVKGRLDFIRKEIERQEGSIKEAQGALEKKQAEIMQFQASIQAAAPPSEKPAT